MAQPSQDLNAAKQDRALLERVVQEAGGRPGRGAGKWHCPFCPPDKRESLSIAPNEHGHFAANCHREGCQANGARNVFDFLMLAKGYTEFREAVQEVASITGTAVLRPAGSDPPKQKHPDADPATVWCDSPEACYGDGPRPGAVYHWQMTDGRNAVKLRFGQGKDKRMLWACEHPKQPGRWRRGGYKGPAKYKPYGIERLPREQRFVPICEGEKAADCLTDLGIPALSFGGSSGVARVDWSGLEERLCVILPDADEPGRKAARTLRDELVKQKALVSLLELPELEEGEDVFDLVNDHWQSKEAEEIRNELLMRLYESNPEGEGFVPIRSAAEYASEPIRWLWRKRLVRGHLSTFFGPGGGGKTSLLYRVVAHVSAGLDWPDGSPCERGLVMVLTLEDSEASVRDRVRLSDGDPNRVIPVKNLKLGDGSDLIALDQHVPMIREGIAHLERLHGERVTLIAIDPLGHCTGKADSYSDADMRRLVLGPFLSLCESTQACGLLIAHTKKGLEARAEHLLAGSVGVVNIARTNYYVGDIDQSGEVPDRVMVSTKTNYGRAPSLNFSIRGIYASNDPTPDDVSLPIALWNDDQSRDLTSAQLLQALKVEPEKEQTKSELAVELIKCLIRESKDPTGEGVKARFIDSICRAAKVSRQTKVNALKQLQDDSIIRKTGRTRNTSYRFGSLASEDEVPDVDL